MCWNLKTLMQIIKIMLLMCFLLGWRLLHEGKSQSQLPSSWWILSSAAEYVLQTCQTLLAERVSFMNSWWIINGACDSRSQGRCIYSPCVSCHCDGCFFSCIRSCCRGGRAEASGPVAASCRAAKETKGRRGGEVRRPCTVRAALCFIFSDKYTLITIHYSHCTIHTCTYIHVSHLILQAKPWLRDGRWSQPVHFLLFSTQHTLCYERTTNPIF